MQACIAVDEVGSAIKWLPTADAQQKKKQDALRATAVECLKAGPVAEFICRVAWASEQPELLGVISLLDNQVLAVKTMWSGAVKKALDSGNVSEATMPMT